MGSNDVEEMNASPSSVDSEINLSASVADDANELITEKYTLHDTSNYYSYNQCRYWCYKKLITSSFSKLAQCYELRCGIGVRGVTVDKK